MMPVAVNFLIACEFLMLLLLAVCAIKRYELPAWVVAVLVFVCLLPVPFLDAFVHIWDERFHALVAKNLQLNYLHPTLYHTEVSNIGVTGWDTCGTWLHKQPFFMWCMAQCYTFFGNDYWAGRVPALLFYAVGAGLFYHALGYMKIKLSLRYVAVLLLCTNLYMIALITGRQYLDQNDAVFVALVLIGFSALLWWFYKPGWLARMLMVLSVAAAVLTKWLPGLFVFFMYALLCLLARRKQGWQWFMDLLLVVALVLPWQVYAAVHYPKYYWLEMELVSKHFTQAVEGQRQAWNYHFMLFETHFGWGYVVAIGLGLLAWWRSQKPLFLTILLALLGTYGFYTLAATKMPSFVFILWPLMVLLAIAALQWLADKDKRVISSGLIAALVVALVYLQMRPAYFYQEFVATQNNDYVQGMQENRKLFKQWKFTQRDVVYNMPGRSYIELMFYTPAVAYHHPPNTADYAMANKLGMRVHCFVDTSKNDTLPRFTFPVLLIKGKIAVFE